jgi:hypothetical protein
VDFKPPITITVQEGVLSGVPIESLLPTALVEGMQNDGFFAGGTPQINFKFY